MPARKNSQAWDEIAALPNLGVVSAKMLLAAGIASLTELQALGAVRCFLRVEQQLLKPPSLNLLYALEGALVNTHWCTVKREMGGQLILELDAARQALKA
ncbi:hypothetical protein EZV61_03680 [Corallincola luteus]|uniref:TfoX C-terminal domain-containing protein n=1 Tax=Corallincola luteus TaxID=1775177 RepID=A0ABY2AQ30_9GAMM|nr:TfoX/Sxy family DNA transformation protein [Corallincola luteus]TCI05071.1 hypothetical protein EZV61_03680 [Corallincola luteus]